MEQFLWVCVWVICFCLPVKVDLAKAFHDSNEKYSKCTNETDLEVEIQETRVFFYDLGF